MLKGPTYSRQRHRNGEEDQRGLLPHSLIVSGRRTSARLEPVMWEALLEIAGELQLTVDDLVTRIDGHRVSSNRTAAIRSFVVSYYRARAVGAELPL